MEWKAVPMSHAAHRIATRTANPFLVGAPLCRDDEYLNMSIQYTVDVLGGADKLRGYPDFLKAVVAKYALSVKSRQTIARKHLIPYIKARLVSEANFMSAGKTAEWESRKASDSLQWIIDAAPTEREKDPERLMYRMLHLNVSAVRTTSVTFLNCMFDLATHLDMREELRLALRDADGAWNKQTVQKLRKLDSFMLESQRLAPMASSQMTGAVIPDFRFSDGTLVPKGSYVLCPMHAMYLDDEIFPNAAEFDAFRFHRTRERPGEENRHQFVSTSPTHINFGHGTSACPGRFFAANEIKLLLAYTLLHYDVHLEDGNSLSQPTWYDRSRRPYQQARVIHRSRTCG